VLLMLLGIGCTAISRLVSSCTSACRWLGIRWTR